MRLRKSHNIIHRCTSCAKSVTSSLSSDANFILCHECHERQKKLVIKKTPKGSLWAAAKRDLNIDSNV